MLYILDRTFYLACRVGCLVLMEDGRVIKVVRLDDFHGDILEGGEVINQFGVRVLRKVNDTTS